MTLDYGKRSTLVITRIMGVLGVKGFDKNAWEGVEMFLYSPNAVAMCRNAKATNVYASPLVLVSYA